MALSRGEKQKMVPRVISQRISMHSVRDVEINGHV